MAMLNRAPCAVALGPSTPHRHTQTHAKPVQRPQLPHTIPHNPLGRRKQVAYEERHSTVNAAAHNERA